MLLASIEGSNGPVDCLIAQATAQGVCLGLDMRQGLARPDVERIEILVVNVADLRLAELAYDAQPQPISAEAFKQSKTICLTVRAPLPSTPYL